MRRRTFLASLVPSPFGFAAPRELTCEVAIIGAGVGGCAAALGALRNGRRVVLTEGGRLDRRPVDLPSRFSGRASLYRESFGCTQAYREYRNAVREFYCQNYPLTETARCTRFLNPGNAWVHDWPTNRVSLAVLENPLSPYASGGRLTVLHPPHSGCGGHRG
jgi:choline dehydrogenase-like flavoprotein